MAIAVAVDGEIVWSEALGYSDVGKRTPVTEKTIFPIYSASKAMTGAAAARLVERGELSLEASIGNYRPDLSEALQTITVAELVAHTSGVRDYWPFEWFYFSARPCKTTDEALAHFVNDELDHEPGDASTYASYGYVLLSAVLEAAADLPFDELMRRDVFLPSDMRSASLASRPGADVDRAKFYREGKLGGYVSPGWIDNSCKFGAGAVWSSAEGLARFGMALLDGKIVSAENVPSLFVSFTTTDGTPVDYGMGWGVNREIDGRRYAGHSGGAMGGRSAIVVLPDDRVAIGIAANLEGPRVVDQAAAIGDMFADARETLARTGTRQ